MWDSAYQNPLGFSEVEGGKVPDPQEQAFLDAARERYEYCLKMAKMFKSKEGKEVLKVWRQNTIEAATWSASLANSENNGMAKANAHAYAREGQNAFVQDVERCIEIAHKCKTLDDFCAMINQLGTVNINT